MSAARNLDPAFDTSSQEGIAAFYAQELSNRIGKPFPVTHNHLAFAQAILSRDAYGLKSLANGLNDVGKAVFTRVTGLALPRTQSGTWATLLDWAAIDPLQDKLKQAEKHLQGIHKRLQERFTGIDRLVAFAQENYERGFVQVIKDGRRFLMAEATGKLGLNLSARGFNGEHSRPYIEAFLAVQQIKVELGLQQEPVYVQETPATSPAEPAPSALSTPSAQLTEQMGMGF